KTIALRGEAITDLRIQARARAQQEASGLLDLSGRRLQRPATRQRRLDQRVEIGIVEAQPPFAIRDILSIADLKAKRIGNVRLRAFVVGSHRACCERAGERQSGKGASHLSRKLPAL